MHASSSSSRFSTLWRMKPYVMPHKKSLLGVFISLAFTSFSVLGLGKGIQYLIDKGFSSHNPALLDQALLVLLLVTVLLALATYARASLINAICEKVVAALRRDIYTHVIRLSPGYFEVHKSSDVLSRLTTDTTVINTIIASVLSVSLRNILLLVGGMTLLIITSPKLTAYVLVIVPMVVVPIITLGRKVRGLSKLSQEKVAAVGAHIEESLSGIKTVQAYVREGFECERFEKEVKGALSTALTRVKVRSSLVALVIATVFGSVACVLWLGGHEVLAGRMTAGELSSFIFYAIVVASSVGALSEIAGDMQRAAGAAERLFELQDAKLEISDPVNPLTLPANYGGDIRFDHVTFYYPARPDHPALSHFSLQVNPGETIALVGPSGAGKSTVFQLLLRFYEQAEGTIALGGIDIRKLTLSHLRSHYGLVAQEPVIFSATVLENIRYARPEASYEEVAAAARAAEAMEFIQKLPEGMETFVGERGVRLSGGQRQRIAIARAILKDPKILLLDEATSSLDAENEQAVQKALEGLMKGRTTLVIAHRLSTILKADKIIVINEGRIEATGTHKELMAQEGLYARLAKLQFHA